MLTVREIQRVTKGVLLQEGRTATIAGVSINSREIKKGSLFIAIKGPRFDGHDFIGKAIRNGAVAAVVSKNVTCPRGIAVIRVKDATRALGQIALWHRKRFCIPVVAITGSAGKTTTKEMTAAVLAKRFKVLKNIGTQNNQYGVPLTLLRLNASHTAAVLELGTNQPGDIRWLAQIVRPTITIFTNIGESHLEKLKNPSGVLREKIQLIKFMDPEGTIIFNGDDRFLSSAFKARKGRKILCFGCGGKVDYQARQIEVPNNYYLDFKIQRRAFRIRSSAAHNVYNALAAISCGLVCKIRYNEIVAALNRFQFHGARQEIQRIGRLWLIDDTYNANPISLRSAIRTLSTLRIHGKRIVVCADMLELGSRSKALHQAAGRMIAQSGVDVVLTIGPHARYIAQEFNRYPKAVQAIHCGDLKEVQRQLKRFCRPGDAVLVKGSRGMQMERAVTFLKTCFH